MVKTQRRGRLLLSIRSIAVAVFLSAGLSGCSSLGYLLQAGKGQWELSNRARPLDEVVREEKTPPRIRELLKEVPAIKAYGEVNGLKPTKNYSEYVALNRPYAVWVVSACEALQFKSKEWRFPIVGAFPYLGWFDRERALDFKQELDNEGWDVDLRGARAYSTLGWFKDAILSSMIPEGDEALGDLVNVILHESVHATVYLPGQAYFNESLASFVADRLTLDYLVHLRGGESKEKLAYVKAEESGEKAQRRLHEAYLTLNALYSSTKTTEEKRAEKRRILAELKDELKFKREINNATLVQYKTYHTGGTEFTAVFDACGKDWRRFLNALSQLKTEDFGKSQQEDLRSALERVTKSGC